MRYVILGNSAAAIGCVEGIRRTDPQGSITIVGEEPYSVYSRPLISYLLAGKVTEEQMQYRPLDFYQRQKCKVILGAKAVKIDAENRKVFLKDGASLSYGRLLLATGSVPFVPPIPGLETVPQKFTFLTLDSAKALQKAVTPQSRVLILGAGLIGLKCAEGLFSTTQNLTVVDLADRVLPSVLDKESASILQKQLETNNIQFHLGTSVVSFSGNTAQLTTGETISFDCLVLASGVRPNITLAQETGLETDRGILIDSHGQTSQRYIYAAGDCAQGYDSSTQSRRVLALLPNAFLQGENAGRNMARYEQEYIQAIPLNSVGFFGMHIMTAGVQAQTVYCKKQGETYRKFMAEDGILKGFILIGNIERAGIYTDFIRRCVPLSGIDFDKMAEEPQLLKIQAAAAEQGGTV